MKRTKAIRTAEFYTRMQSLGFTYEEANTLRLAEMTLHRWTERECNGEVERDEETGKTYNVSVCTTRTFRYPTPDRETGALKRIASIVEARNGRRACADHNGDRHHADLTVYHQTDPRGCALYILRPGDVPAGEKAESYYSRGIAVCI